MTEETKIVQVEQRKICWPPDWCCLEGGCGYCNGFGEWKNLGEIFDYAKKVGVKKYDDGTERDYVKSYEQGRAWGWPNTQQRTVPRRVKA